MSRRDDASGMTFWNDADDTEARERYQTLIETIDDGIYQLDTEGRFVAVNDVVIEMTGYPREELLGEHVSVLFDDDAVSAIDRETERLREDQSRQSNFLELTVETASGDRIHWELRVNPLVEDGTVEGTIGIARDVTERKRRERGRKRVIEALDVAHEGISLLDEHGVFIYVNEAYAETFGYDPEEMVGNHWDALGIEADPDQFYDYILPQLSEEGQWTGTTTCIRSDGSQFLAAHTLTQTEDDELICVVRNVTERRQRERALEESEQRYRALAEYFPNGVVTLFDHDLNYTLAAGQGFDRIPHEPAELENRHFREVWGEDTADDLEPLFQAALDGREQSTEVPYAGREWLVHAVPITDQRGEVFAGMTMARDITERKERERELEESERLYRTLAENFPNGAVGIYDEDLRYDLVEGAMWDDMEPDAADLEGRTIHEAFSPDITSDIEPIFRAAIDDGETGSTLTEFVGRTLRVWATPLRDSDGEIFAGLSFAQDITEQRERERELEESERRYRTLAENIPNGAVGLVDQDLRYLTIGGTPLGDREMDAADLEGRPVREVLSAELAEHLAPRYEAALAGESSTFEYEHRDGDRHTRFHTFPVRDDEGNVFAAMGMSQDITEQVEREAELERALDLLERTERIADVGGWEIDVDTKEVFWTDHIFDLLEVPGDEEPPLEEALGMYYEADQPLVEDAVETALESGDPFDVEVRIRTNAGERRWLRLQGIPETSDGEVVSLRGAAQDVTERKEREQQLRQQRERLTALNNLNEIVRDINRALVRQSTRAEMERTVCERLAESDSYEFAWVGTVGGDSDGISPSTSADADGSIEAVVQPDDSGLSDRGPATRAVRTGETAVVRGNEAATHIDRWREHSHGQGIEGAAAVPIGYEDSFYGVLNVYTTRTNAFGEQEQEVISQLGEIMGLAMTAIEHERQLRHQHEQLAFINSLLRHNLLNDLNIIHARAGILEPAVGTEGRQHLEIIQTHADEMADLIDTLRALTEALVEDEHELEPVDLGAVLREEIDKTASGFEDATFDIVADLDAGLTALADELLSEVFRNLLVNAIQHNDNAVPRVTVDMTVDDEHVTVDIADNGPGIPDELKDRLFEKGEKHRHSRGTGYGLYLVREIVDLYDGEMAAENTETGAVFSVTLPRA